MDSLPILIFIRGPLQGQVMAVPDDGGLTIGRSDENGFVIAHEDVSRFHARLDYDNGSLWIRDVGSRNGVFVNDNRVSTHRALKVGDRVAIADHVLEVRWADDAAESTDEAGEDDDNGARKRSWFWPFS